MATKAKQILKLYEKHAGAMAYRKLQVFIAAKVGTTEPYVRTVARQRRGRGQSEAERRYLESPLGRAKCRRNCQAYWRRVKADPAKHAAYREKDRIRHHERYWRSRKVTAPASQQAVR